VKLWAALAGLALCGCSLEPGTNGDSRCAPAQLDGGVLLRIDRTTESRTATDLMREVEAAGVTDPVAAVYEFSFMRNKPVFHFVVGRGVAEPQRLLDQGLRIFGGKLRPGGVVHPREDRGASFQCIDFDRMPGLVGRSAACAFSESGISGYGLRIDGGEIEDALKYTVQARRAYLQRAATRSCSDAVALAEQAEPRTDLESVAREIVADVAGYDCDLLAQHYEPDAAEFFRAQIDAELLDRSRDPVERVCFVLGTLEYPQAEDLAIEVVSQTPNRAVLHLRHDSTSGRWFSEERRSELVLSHETGEWKVDHRWALAQVQDLAVRLQLYSAASNLQSDASIKGRFEPGFASDSSRAGVVFVQSAGAYGCATVRSRSGAFFLARVETRGYTFARSDRPWSECPAKPLTRDWRDARAER
jgi:hypothetical protein